MLGTTRLGQWRAFGLLALGSLLLVFAACQIVVGIQSRTLDPERGGCALPSGSGPQVRIADFVPTSERVDVCIRAAGTSWGEPLLLNGGTGCSGSSYFDTADGGAVGFGYGETSVPFAASAVTVDAKIVTAGDTCASAALGEADGVTLDPKSVTTLVRVGGDGAAEQLVALPENDSPNPANTIVRFVNAMPGVGPLDFGLPPPGVAHLPTTLATPVLSQPLSFGHAPSAGEAVLSGTASDRGYVNFIGGAYTVVAAVHGASPEKAVLLAPLSNMSGSAYSLYAAGTARSNEFPQRGFLCPENGPAPTSGNPLVVPCTATPLPTISIDVVNTSLYGLDAPNFDARELAFTDPKGSPVLARDSDVMCLVELDYVDDLQALATNASADAGGNGSFPYSYWIRTSVDTPSTDPSTLDGGMPAPLSAPPCGGNVSQQSVQTAFQCMEQYCSTSPNSPGGRLTTVDCLTTHCTGALGGVLISYPSCFDCIVDYVVSGQTFGAGQTSCTTLAQRPFGFGGQVPLLILSRYPLVDTDAFVLPSTNYRRGVLYSRVQLEDQQVDFYCGFLTTTLIAGDLPYEGAYGAGGNQTSDNEGGAYANEQYLQALDLIRWVKQKSGNRPAIVVGDWHSSAGVAADAGAPSDSGSFAPPSALVPGTVGALASASGWTAVQAPGWTPLCNSCPESENPLNAGQTVGYFWLQPFLVGWPQPSAALTDESLIYTQPVVPFGDAGLAPITQYYGLNFHVIRPQ